MTFPNTHTGVAPRESFKGHRAHIEQINGKVLVNITKSKKECDGIGFHQFLQVTYHKN